MQANFTDKPESFDSHGKKFNFTQPKKFNPRNGNNVVVVHTNSHESIGTIVRYLAILPSLIASYLQMLMNCGIVALVLKGSYQFIQVLSLDLDKHIYNQSQQIYQDVILCSREYVRNSCGQPLTPPAIEPMCDGWRSCMDQEVTQVLGTHEAAFLLAQTLNKFFDGLSDRTIYCVGVLFIGSIIFVNLALTYTKSRSRSLT